MLLTYKEEMALAELLGSRLKRWISGWKGEYLVVSLTRCAVTPRNDPVQAKPVEECEELKEEGLFSCKTPRLPVISALVLPVAGGGSCGRFVCCCSWGRREWIWLFVLHGLVYFPGCFYFLWHW